AKPDGQTDADLAVPGARGAHADGPIDQFVLATVPGQREQIAIGDVGLCRSHTSNLGLIVASVPQLARVLRPSARPGPMHAGHGFTAPLRLSEYPAFDAGDGQVI